MKKNFITSKKYIQIVNFVDRLRQETFLKELEKKDIEKKIDVFLDKNDIDEFSTVSFLLKLMKECQSDSGKTLFISLILSRCVTDKTTELMIKSIESPNITDKIRKRLIFLLDMRGETETIRKSVEHFKNKQRLAESAVQSILSDIGSCGEDKNNLYRHLINQTPEFYRMFTHDLICCASEQSFWLLGIMASYPNEEIATLAITALEDRKLPLACEVLESILPFNEKLDKCRRKALEQLKEDGVHKAYQRVFLAHKCYLSEIEGNGNRYMLISQRSGRSRLAMVTFMLNEEEGIQDCSSWADMSSFEMESVIKSLEIELRLKQVDYAKGIPILEDALWTTIHGKGLLPFSFLGVRKYLGEQLLPRPYVVDVKRLGIESVKKRLNSLVEESAELLQSCPFSEWCLENRISYEFVRERRSLLNGHKLRKGTLSQFIKAALEMKREVWQQRFLMTADFLYQLSPRGYRQKIDICLALYLAISKEIPLKSIPFMVKLAENTIEKIRDKIHTNSEI